MSIRRVPALVPADANRRLGHGAEPARQAGAHAQPSPLVASGAGVSWSHAWQAPGSYTLPRAPVGMYGMPAAVWRCTWRTLMRTLAQVKDLADHASEAVRAAIWVSVLTGCRRGEVLAIRPDMIGKDAITLPAGATKMLRTRTVPIIPPLRPWLKHIGAEGLGINFEGLKTGVRRAREAAGMAHVHYHDMRHSCATILLALGTPLDVVRDILGHTTIKTTERYAHAVVARQRTALEGLGALAEMHQPRTPATKAAA